VPFFAKSKSEICLVTPDFISIPRRQLKILWKKIFLIFLIHPPLFLQKRPSCGNIFAGFPSMEIFTPGEESAPVEDFPVFFHHFPSRKGDLRIVFHD